VFTVTIGMDPEIVRIGPLLLTWHGLFTALAILAAVWLAGREIARRGITIPNFDLVVVLTILGGIVGARLFFVLDHLGEYLHRPWRILAITEGGLAVYGGIIGGTPCSCGGSTCRSDRSRMLSRRDSCSRKVSAVSAA
jgi:phosphatidylglycerol:prolipoprotein diacylglycerol transferase